MQKLAILKLISPDENFLDLVDLRIYRPFYASIA
jgi:hypothetical protein